MYKGIRRLALAALAVSAAGCGDDVPEATPDAGDQEPGLTYYRDIKPIIDAKCAGCHFEGGIAPMALDTYEQVQTHAGVSKLAIEQDLMPPWPPNGECDEYVGDRSLTPEQKQSVLDWIDDGAPAGDPADEGEPIEVEQPSLSRVDLTLEMPVEYTPTKTPDDYRCFLVPWPEDETTFVTGFRAVPGNDRIVHHVIAFLAQPDMVDEYLALDEGEEGPGYTCFGGTEGPSQEWIGGWAPGSQGSDLPEGTGIRVEPGSMIILQVHYNVLHNEPEPDQTAVEVRLDDTVDKEGIIMPWANPNWVFDENGMHIPPNEPDVMHSFSWDATVMTDGQPFRIHSSGLHMHNLGTRALTRIDRADDSSDCLLQIDDWDFHWQGGYGHREPQVFNPGDQLYLECHWDNTPENQPVVDGEPLTPGDVYWGEGTTDEMCLAVFYVTEL